MFTLIAAVIMGSLAQAHAAPSGLADAAAGGTVVHVHAARELADVAARAVAMHAHGTPEAGTAAAVTQQPTDTTFAVPARGRLSVEAMNGSISVTTWDRNAIRVRTRSGSRGDIEISRRGSSVDIEAEGWRGPQNVALDIVVPPAWSVQAEGVNLRVTVAGVQAGVNIENVEGAVSVSNVTGSVAVESVSGDITVSAVRGTVQVNTTNKAVRLDDIRGSIEAETVNGSIIMRRIDSPRVEASTVQGIVEYQGTLREGGRYYLGTHNGRITMSVPEQANARIAVSTFNGKVETSFPVQITRVDDGEYALTLGSGSARVQLESYNGSVYLIRPGNR